MRETAPDDAAAPPVKRGDFVVVAGHGRLITHMLDKAETVIGRDGGCDLAIDHPALSRRHAVLRLGPPLTVQDLGSTNGVKVSRRITRGGEPIRLEAGETFYLGGFSFNVVVRSRGVESSGSGQPRLRIDDPTADGVPRFVHDVAASDTSVLILGESGTGKDLLAETLHVLSGRAGELARVNCAALAEPLIESELFGHEKGAFTGAHADKPGLLESAAGGTVFLDEIGELALAMQAKLLRAIESREVRRIGATRATMLDVRFIAATNRDLPAEVAARRFRHDLYFRLDGISLFVPPLRERRDQIGALAIGFLQRAARRRSPAPVRITPAALAALDHHPWPGNVRELKAVIERGFLLARGGEIDVRHLVFSPPTEATPPAPPAAPPASLAPSASPEETQRRELIDALEQCGGNQTRAARALGISRTTLVNRVKLFKLNRPRG